MVVGALRTEGLGGFANMRGGVAKELRGSAVMADDGGCEVLSVRTGGDVIRGVEHAGLSQNDARIASDSIQPNKNIIERNRETI